MRILIGVAVLALAVPASAGLINGSFEDGLNGWTVTNVRLDADQYVPNPPTMDGDHRAGDSNCNARDSLGWQEAACDVNPAAECHLLGYLAGGDVGGYSYWVRVGNAPGDNSLGEVVLSGVNNWTEVDIPLGPCLGQTVVVSFGSTGNGTWGPAGYHVDALELVCIPEPATGLLLLGLVGLPWLRRR